MKPIPLQRSRRVLTVRPRLAVLPAPAEPVMGGRRVPQPPKNSVRHAVQLVTSRPHLFSRLRPKVKCCKACRNAPPYNPDPYLRPPSWIADGLDMAARWNA